MDWDTDIDVTLLSSEAISESMEVCHNSSYAWNTLIPPQFFIQELMDMATDAIIISVAVSMGVSTVTSHFTCSSL